MATYRTSKSYVPGAGFNGASGKQRNAKQGYGSPPDQESPQRLGDRDNLRDYDGTIPARGWLRGSDATRMPHFDRTGKKDK